MLQGFKINVGNLLLSISDAVDMVSPAIASHQLRTAYIAWQIAIAAGLPRNSVRRLFKASLLHDIGALAPEDKIKLHAFEAINTEPHCIIGELLFRMTPLLEKSAGIVRFHHRKWSDWHTSIETPDVLESQILYTADFIERLIRRDVFILNQVDSITSHLESHSGSAIHNGVVDLFIEVASREDFWLDITNNRLYSILHDHGPLHGTEDDFSVLTSIAVLVRSLIDFKSNFTATHSIGVSECAVQLAALEGFTEFELQCMEVAGNLHDLGKLAVPVAILDKPGELSPEECTVIKQHPYFTYMLLKNIGMEQIAQWAAFHHEFLDGSGYPFHVTSERLTLGARIMAVANIFTSLREDRPQRPGKSLKETKEILQDYSRKGLLDSRIIHVLFDDFENIGAAVKEKQDEARRYYVQQVRSFAV